MGQIMVANELLKLAKLLLAAGSYTKLRDGSWGIRVDGEARSGQTVEITTKAGKRKKETIGRVMWTGKDNRSGQIISLCTIKPSSRRVAPSPSNSRHRPDRRFPGWDGVVGSPSYYTSGAFDEYDM